MHDDPAAGAPAAGSRPVADGPDPAARARAVPDAEPRGPDSAAPGTHAGTALAASVPPVGSSRSADRRFADRRAAGRALGKRLAGDTPGDPIVLGLPRGGVVVAAEVATVLAAPLDVLVVRKLGLPGRPELAMGAIAAVGNAVRTVRVDSVLTAAAIDVPVLEEVRQREIGELRRREAAYRGDRPAAALEGRDVVLVDDGLATGATMHVAVVAVRCGHPASVTVAVPVGSPRACATIGLLVDRIVCLSIPTDFRAVGQAYDDFTQTSDDDVRTALEAAGRRA
ncbi:MAG: hypothetical protein AVDCRST_MAG52-2339 [uncultured Blastococcus sp.]|uniref:Phosphoribosyltransferase domain-containing protein n=1 Tax=uncultured Blastococcus sp. TaxID=217144 RepID=A0A6J4IN34_9ACTN|nr:MAG: hypothetical protein AVDCRST_MAG52-2339 [uncultured Blastococcus sp.]